jgi:hypothetical protein
MHERMEACRFSVVVAHRRFGKTVAVVNHLIKAAVGCRLPRPRYGYVAPLYSQAKSIAWDYLKHYTAPIPGVRRNESELWVELPNAARIRLFGADNPDSLRGMYFDGVALDELAQMKPETWTEVIRPALTDRGGFGVFIGTPKGVNIFYELYQQAIRDPKWFAGFYPVSKTAVIPAEELEAARATMSDNQYRQEFECDFAASNENVLITIDVVNAAAGRDYHPSTYMQSPKVLGVDVARFGDDKSVFIYRQGTVAFGLKKMKDQDTMRLAGLVAQEIEKEKPDAVFIDVVGIGAGVVDRLRQLNHRVIGVNAGSAATDDAKYANKRAEMWCSMRDWLAECGQVPGDLELRNDLAGPTYHFDNRNRILIEKKEDMKKRGLASPDAGDALSLTFAQPVARREGVAVLQGQRPVLAQMSYQLFG